MCSHLVRVLLSAADGKAHLWRSHGVWHCAWRGLTGRGASPTLAWSYVQDAVQRRELQEVLYGSKPWRQLPAMSGDRFSPSPTCGDPAVLLPRTS